MIRTRLSIREKVKERNQQILEELKGTGYWLNHREIQFDHDYGLPKDTATQGRVEAIREMCSLPDRKDSLQKLETIISNLLRHCRRFPVIVALATRENKMSEIIAKLENHSLVEVRRGNPLISRYSRMWPTMKFLNYFEKVATPFLVIDPVQLVVVRDDNKNPIQYTKSDHSRNIEAILRRANKINKTAAIQIDNQPLNTAIIAIFRRKLTLYGRLHTKGCYHYQGLNEDERAEITINGDSVVELDFSGLHPHLLYAMEGEQLKKDPYSIVANNNELRPFLKKCLLIILNATSCIVKGKWYPPKNNRKEYYRKAYPRSAEENAEGSINQHIKDYIDKKLKNVLKSRLLRSQYILRRKALLKENGITTARDIIDRFKEALPEIAHHFFSDKETGLKIMNKDATIALYIVDHFVKQGIPILAIHDSFIVQQQYKDELHQTMDKVYKKHAGGFSCQID